MTIIEITKTVNTAENQEKVARKFIEVLERWEGDKVTSDFVRDANDHYDANMAMDEALRFHGFEAFKDCPVLEDRVADEDVLALFDASWTRAIAIAPKTL